MEIAGRVDARVRGGRRNCAFNQPAAITSLGYNLEDANDCGFGQAGDLTRSDPRLGALGDNGGPTATMALPATSPAVDAADPRCDAATDQRGITRPQGPRCDIGAYELQGVTPSPTTLPSPPATGRSIDRGGTGPLPAAALILVLLVVAGAAGLGVRRRRSG